MDYLRGNLTPVSQDESLVTVAAKIDKAEARIDWSRPARSIFNRVRGLAMGPAAFALRSNQPLKIHRTRVIAESANHGAPGSVIAVNPQTFKSPVAKASSRC